MGSTFKVPWQDQKRLLCSPDCSQLRCWLDELKDKYKGHCRLRPAAAEAYAAIDETKWIDVKDLGSGVIGGVGNAIISRLRKQECGNYQIWIAQEIGPYPAVR